MVVAAIDWPAAALVGTVVVTALTSLLTYKRGTRTDDQLNLSNVTQANFTAMDRTIDQLQEENGRLRTRVAEGDQTEARLRNELRDQRHEAASAHAALRAGELVMAQKDVELEEKDEIIAGLKARLSELEPPDG